LFIQEFLRVQNEDIISGLEKMLKKQKAELYAENLKPMSPDEFDADIVAELRSRARDVLLTRAIASEEKLETAEPAQDLLDMEGMTKDLARTLASKGVITLDDLADQSVDELAEIEGIDAEHAAVLIMKARESWFADEQIDAGE
jgi:N utilization substance protein A